MTTLLAYLTENCCQGASCLPAGTVNKANKANPSNRVC